MTAGTRIRNIITALLMLLAVWVIITYEDGGYVLIMGIMSTSLLVGAFRRFVYFFTMARFMVGGTIELYKAIVLANFGLIVWNISYIPKGFIIVYLIVGLIFSGLVDVLRANESRCHGSIHWKIKFIRGLVIVLISVASLFFARESNIEVYLYCFGLVVSALSRIIESCRKTAIVYIS